jgi:hypothetical protein
MIMKIRGKMTFQSIMISLNKPRIFNKNMMFSWKKLQILGDLSFNCTTLLRLYPVKSRKSVQAQDCKLWSTMSKRTFNLWNIFKTSIIPSQIVRKLGMSIMPWYQQMTQLIMLKLINFTSRGLWCVSKKNGGKCLHL